MTVRSWLTGRNVVQTPLSGSRVGLKTDTCLNIDHAPNSVLSPAEHWPESEPRRPHWEPQPKMRDQSFWEEDRIKVFELRSKGESGSLANHKKSVKWTRSVGLVSLHTSLPSLSLGGSDYNFILPPSRYKDSFQDFKCTNICNCHMHTICQR